MTETTTNNSTITWPTLLQVIFTGAAVLISWGLAAFLAIGVVNELLSPSGDLFALSSVFSLVLASLVVGGLFAASLFYGFMRLLGKTVELGKWWQVLRKLFHPKRMLLAYPLVLLLGYFANTNDAARNFALPVLNILALGIPVLGLVWLALRGLPKGSPQLGWGALSLGLAVGPTVVLLLEIIVLILMIVVLVISAELDPALMDSFSELSMLTFEADSAYHVDQAVGALLNTPQIVIALLAVLAGFVPLIEEFFKPISVWVLLGRKLRPVDGWVIGALSGAGFALFESFGQATISEDWWVGVIARFGASIPHVFTTALMGYTLALARTQRKYGKVFLVYLGVVAIHSAWNASFVLNLVVSYDAPNGWLDPKWAPVFLVVVGLLALGMIIALLRINRRLRTEFAQAEPIEMQPTAALPLNLEPDAKETQLDGTDYNAD